MRFVFALAVFFVAGAAYAEKIQAPPFIVAELFTSQSCSSCPPADAVLEKLAARNDVIALGCHVTYWNYLNWRDTFSLNACTDRQKEYARRLEQFRTYTPNMVINGRISMVGSREQDIDNAIEKMRREFPVTSIPVTRDADGRLFFDLPDLPRGDYVTTFMLLGRGADVAIGSGENDGATVHYAAPVRAMKAGPAWDGTPKQHSIPAPTGADIAQFIVLIQSNKGGPILAAGRYKY